MFITTLRSTSKGLEGTIENANCHARKLIPLIHELATHLKTLPYKEWKQGNNIHLLITDDNRTFALRPFSKKAEGYIGITVFARASRSKEIPLSTIYTDQRNGINTQTFIELLKNLAHSRGEHINLSLTEAKSLEQAI